MMSIRETEEQEIEAALKRESAGTGRDRDRTGS